MPDQEEKLPEQTNKNLVEVAKKKRQIHLLDKLQKGKPFYGGNQGA